MSRRNSLTMKSARRAMCAARPVSRRPTAGICRGTCGDQDHRTLILPERICIECFNGLAYSLVGLRRVFG